MIPQAALMHAKREPADGQPQQGANRCSPLPLGTTEPAASHQPRYQQRQRQQPGAQRSLGQRTVRQRDHDAVTHRQRFVPQGIVTPGRDPLRATAGKRSQQGLTATAAHAAVTTGSHPRRIYPEDIGFNGRDAAGGGEHAQDAGLAVPAAGATDSATRCAVASGTSPITVTA